MNRLFGGILLAAGILIATLSGLCSLVFIVSVVVANARTNDPAGEFSSMWLVVIFGGPPIGLGALLIEIGRRILRRNRPIDPSDVF